MRGRRGRCWRKSVGAIICRSWSAALDFICARCSKGSSPGRNARKNCASDCGNVLRSAGRIICIESCAVSIAARLKKFMPTICPKLIRAIEVCLASRQKMSELWQQGRDPLHGFRILRMGLDPDRAALYERINQRASRMFEAGLIEETRAFAAEIRRGGAAAGCARIQAGGSASDAENSRESKRMQAAQQAHRNYAKRQMTWFRREPKVTG